MFSSGSHRGKLCVTNNLIVYRRIAASDGNGCKGAGVCQNLFSCCYLFIGKTPGGCNCLKTTKDDKTYCCTIAVRQPYF